MENVQGRFCSKMGTCCMILIERNGHFLMIAAENGLYTQYAAKKINGVYTLEIENEKPCKMYYKICDDLVTLCTDYKTIKKMKPITLKQKAEENSEIRKLFGSGIFGIWNDYYDEIMHSDHESAKNPQVGDKLLEIAADLKSNGVDDALFSVFLKKTVNMLKTCIGISVISPRSTTTIMMF